MRLAVIGGLAALALAGAGSAYATTYMETADSADTTVTVVSDPAENHYDLYLTYDIPTPVTLQTGDTIDLIIPFSQPVTPSYNYNVGFNTTISDSNGRTDGQLTTFYNSIFQGGEVVGVEDFSSVSDYNPKDPPSLYFAGPVSVELTNAPEPATWALMMIGLGVTGFAIRRRQCAPCPEQGAATAANPVRSEPS